MNIKRIYQDLYLRLLDKFLAKKTSIQGEISVYLPSLEHAEISWFEELITDSIAVTVMRFDIRKNIFSYRQDGKYIFIFVGE